MKHNLDNLALQRKYSAKKKNAAERGINFSLTFNEYKNVFDTNNGYCDYSGMLMSFDHNFRTGEVPANYATLDRVDGSIGYVLSNLALCRKDSNSVKAAGIEHNSKFSSSLSPDDRILLEKVCQTLFNPAKIAELKQKYLLPKEETLATITPTTTLKEEETIMQTFTTEELNKKPSVTHSDETLPETGVIASGNRELTLAEDFAMLGRTLEGLGAEYNLTFSSYKTLMQKKFCSLSKRKFSSTVKPTLWIIQKTLPVDKDNVLVVDNSLSEMLDIMSVKGKMNLVELKDFATNLGNQLKKKGV